MIRAIETKYNGYHFRSRLEARWAVFFDSFWKYSYEPEGFNLGELGWYLPDFYIPAFDSYIEIKPSEAAVWDDLETIKSKCFVLSQQSNKKVLLICGDPRAFYHSLTVFYPNKVRPLGYPGDDSFPRFTNSPWDKFSMHGGESFFAQMRHFPYFVACIQPRSDLLISYTIYLQAPFLFPDIPYLDAENKTIYQMFDSKRISKERYERAYSSATSARF